MIIILPKTFAETTISVTPCQLLHLVKSPFFLLFKLSTQHTGLKTLDNVTVKTKNLILSAQNGEIVLDPRNWHFLGGFGASLGQKLVGGQSRE